MRQHLIRLGITDPRANLIREARQFIYQLVAPPPPAPEKEKASEFPHKGKHLAIRKGADDTKALCKKTERGPAKYLSRDTPEIMELETKAINEGLKITEGIFIHIFNEHIGASQGQMTKCIRIDGNHGHPIEEDGSKTSFTGYIQRAIAEAIQAGDKARIQEILAYLAKTQYHVDFFKRSIPPGLLPSPGTGCAAK